MKLLFPPPGGGKHTINNTVYQAADGVGLQVANPDVVNQLAASGWSIVGGPMCNADVTANRPVNPMRGTPYMDMTLGMLIHYDGAHWRNVATNAIV